jgi:hypothetical protein
MATFDVTDEPVFHLGVESASTAYTSNNFGYDFSVGDSAFLNAISKQTPYRRGLAEIRKQQYDTSSNPGEQSLDGYWLRSQQDFTGGAGITFMEPSNDEFQMKRFASSMGVDCWTRGKLSLLKSTSSTRTLSNASSMCVTAEYNGDKYIVSASGSGVYRNGAASSTITGWTNTPTGWVTSTGDAIVVSTTVGTVGHLEYLAAPFTGTPVVIAETGTNRPDLKTWWVKQRIMVGAGRDLYQLPLDPTTHPTFASLAWHYVHPITTWTWTSCVETPNAILASGYAGNKSAIYKIVLDSAGDLPTLSSAITAAELPYGEIVTGMFSYLGTYVVIGTNKGIRVAQIDGNGDLAYGPLSFTSTSTTTITGFSGKDRFVFVGVGNELDGNSGLIRIDLSSNDGNGRYAWANDLNAGTTGRVNSVATYGDQIVFTNTNLYTESSTDYVSSGYLTTGQVRFNTLEPKNFRSFHLRGDVSVGSVGVSSVLYDQTSVSLLTFTSTVDINQDVAIAYPTNPLQESLGLKIELNRGTTTETPVVTGWQLKAVPGSTRRLLLKIPLICFDHETDQAGAARGYDGYAYDRLMALQDHCVTGQVLVFQDLRTGERLSVTIEDVSFTQETPNGQSGFDNFGGIIELTVQTA